MTIGKRDDEGNFAIPRGVFITALFAVIGGLSGGGFTMGVLFNTVANQTILNEKFQHEIVTRVEHDEAAAQADYRDRSALMDSIHQQLARIEAQLSYAVTNLPGVKK